MNSSCNNPDGVSSVCTATGFPQGFQFQSSEAHLKRFIMFDHSAGKGRVFLHPALAQELFDISKGRNSDKEDNKDAPNVMPPQEGQSESKLSAYREMVANALVSLQSVRSSRQSDITFMSNQAAAKFSVASGTNINIAKGPEVSKDPLTSMDPKIILSGIIPSHIAPDFSFLDENAMIPDFCKSNVSKYDKAAIPGNSQVSGTNMAGEAGTNGDSMHENTEDLDALLSCDCDEDDDDVRSTGHSPDESLGNNCDWFCDEDNADDDLEVQQVICKKRKIDDHEVNNPFKMFKSAEDETPNRSSLQCSYNDTNFRKQKIKKTVRALRKMIPGGALLDAALVLDETILYVKMLRERVNQLEAKRFHS